MIRGKLEQDERLLILRYECIGYGASGIAHAIVVGAVSFWPPLAWVFVAAALGALGLLFKHTLEEAIAAEELNKIHAMEAVITSNISLEDSFARIERLAHRLVDWGDFRIYRRQDGTLRLAYRGQIGRADREAAGGVAQSPGLIRQGVLAEEGEVSGGLEATESLARVSRRVSEDGTEAAQASSTASEVANKNRHQIRDAIGRLVALKAFVGEASSKVQGLGQASRRITGVIASIRELADMTNLLALNAAIEAARAGKHGTSFAVVAEELRRRARQSSRAPLAAG